MTNPQKPLVILVHGIHGYVDMDIPSLWLKHEGFDRKVFRYTPLGKNLEDIAKDFFSFLDKHTSGYESFSIIGHSMGGLVSHIALTSKPQPKLNKVIYISTPFQGSQNADFYTKYMKELFQFTSGEAGLQLCREYLLKNPLKPADYTLGLLAGNQPQPLYFWNRGIMNEKRDGIDDGLVPVSSAFAMNALDKCVIPSDHNFILRNKKTKHQILSFLKTGKFDRSLEGCSFPDA